MTTQDLTQLPAPTVVETLDFETILASHRADLIARYPAAATSSSRAKKTGVPRALRPPARYKKR